MKRPLPRFLAASLAILLCGGAHAAAQTAPDTGRFRYTAADVAFMSGMIHHHAQAVLMAGWAESHGAGSAVRTLCDRIVVAQRDEIALMQRWLRDRNLPAPEADAMHDVMPGMEHLMPGMLNGQQLAQLDSARGPEFDRLFLTDMIRHHQGAIAMVNQLLASQGAGEEETVFRFSSDVYADQTTEIARMQRMLATLLFAGPSGQ
ncbi:MAG TPA: DUF305 domain-containing protein [Gemmatimonadales bacterium]|nr:DUF305 domain-containing protein [Gemmatimonadales bacterium]